MVGGGKLVVGYSPSVVGRMVTSIVGGCQERASESFCVMIISYLTKAEHFSIHI